MGSIYLNGLTSDQRKELEKQLNSSQKGNCFICGSKIDMVLHANAIDIDHVEPLKLGGKDDPSNFALTHASCNRSKQASDLRVARVLAQFGQIRDDVAHENRGPNLSDVLTKFGGAKHELSLRLDGNSLSFSLPQIGRNEIQTVPLYQDELSGLRVLLCETPDCVSLS
jgi:HNH endonuclease